ncbi:transferase family hexapeptide repeat protein [Maribacter vaceletii]|uniref:Transferase family hexapeptide repeat protein n=1 Tax=Maribacter vaceletii TaxID=1206816 RepID=A0A495EDZ4_9FLAO|nr:acyltransferase [Maribacter vaceletii]RKR14773.1 transferase family hexapeptide repeat protein [Maribacter vaceletii]
MIKKVIKFSYDTYRRFSKYFFTYLANLSVGFKRGKLTANGFTLLTKNTKIGSNINFNGLRVFGLGEVNIGDNFHSGRNCKIITDIHNYNGNSLPYDSTYIIKKVIIEDNVWLGSDVTILGGVTIGEGAIVQAGSVVVKDVMKLAIVGGHPASKFSERDKEHYYRLKKLEAFH